MEKGSLWLMEKIYYRYYGVVRMSENEEASTANQDKMKQSLKDYNSNLNELLARKEKKYLDRSQQLNLVIVPYP